MKTKRNIFKNYVVVLRIAGAILLICAVASALLDKLLAAVNESPQRLVYHTDHAAILRACKEVLKDPRAAGFPNPTNGFSDVDRWQNGSKALHRLPDVLQDLDFEFISIQGDQAKIFFGGGFGHWGFSTSPVSREYQMELIPGLWYWSEFGHPRDPSKHPYYLTSVLLFLGSAIAFGLATWLRRRSNSSVVKPIA